MVKLHIVEAERPQIWSTEPKAIAKNILVCI